MNYKKNQTTSIHSKISYFDPIYINNTLEKTSEDININFSNQKLLPNYPVKPEINEIIRFANPPQCNSIKINHYPLSNKLHSPKIKKQICECARKTIPFDYFPVKEFRCYRTDQNDSLTSSKKPIVKKDNYIQNGSNGQLKKKRNRQIDINGICIVCNWDFPKEMNDIEKQTHINECLDGRGKEHIVNYNKTIELITQTEVENQIEEEMKCPFCLKVYRGNVEKHQRNCARKFQK